MIAHAMLALLLLADTDQTVQVRKGARLDVRNRNGDVIVKTWDRDTLHVQATHAEGQGVDIQVGDVTVVVRGRTSNRGGSIDITLTIPAWMPATIAATNGDISVDGARADVSAETTNGDITVRGATGAVFAKSVRGDIALQSVRGTVDARTVNSDIRLSDVTGDIDAGATNGDLTLDRIDTNRLAVSTVNGDISYDGSLKDKGTYRLTTHNGPIRMAVPEKTNATFMVRSYSGSFRSTFPIRLDDQQRTRFILTLGDGSGRVELESFNGPIYLRRPGEQQPSSTGGRSRGRSTQPGGRDNRHQ